MAIAFYHSPSSSLGRLGCHCSLNNFPQGQFFLRAPQGQSMCLSALSSRSLSCNSPGHCLPVLMSLSLPRPFPLLLALSSVGGPQLEGDRKAKGLQDRVKIRLYLYSSLLIWCGWILLLRRVSIYPLLPSPRFLHSVLISIPLNAIRAWPLALFSNHDNLPLPPLDRS